jgi:hypothetical protein
MNRVPILGVMLRLSTKRPLLWLAGICLLVSSSCMSDQEAKAIYDQIWGNQINLGASLWVFQAKYHRWPKDYPELSEFHQQVDGMPVLAHYDRVDFKELTNGNLEVDTVIGTRTNTMTVSKGSNVMANAVSETGPHYNFTK